MLSERFDINIKPRQPKEAVTEKTTVVHLKLDDSTVVWSLTESRLRDVLDRLCGKEMVVLADPDDILDPAQCCSLTVLSDRPEAAQRWLVKDADLDDFLRVITESPLVHLRNHVPVTAASR